jgi:hypothetical protein
LQGKKDWELKPFILDGDWTFVTRYFVVNGYPEPFSGADSSFCGPYVSDGRVLRLIEAMLKAGSYAEGRLFPTERGTPQGSGISPLLSNILLTPFDREMRRRGYQLTWYSDDWVVT